MGLVSLQGSRDQPQHSSFLPCWGFLYVDQGFGTELGGCMNHVTDGTDSWWVLPPGVRYLRLGHPVQHLPPLVLRAGEETESHLSWARIPSSSTQKNLNVFPTLACHEPELHKLRISIFYRHRPTLQALLIPVSPEGSCKRASCFHSWREVMRLAVHPTAAKENPHAHTSLGHPCFPGLGRKQG